MEAVSEFSRSFKVSKFQVTLVCTLVAGKPIGLRFEWSPYYPSGLSGQAFRQYRKKRDAALSALAEHLGGAILAVDQGGLFTVLPDGQVIQSNKEVMK